VYSPPFNVMDPDEVRPFVEQVGSAELVTAGPQGFPQATRLPIVWAGDSLVLHMAIANPHWRTMGPGTPALAVVTGPEGYVSPSWYAGKAEHGRVVPTWNYSTVHVTGHVTVHRDPAWLRDAVEVLTDLHERDRADPWHVADAPETFVAQQLKGIVGIELRIAEVRAKAKRSQNRSDADRARVVEGLRAEQGHRGAALAEQMAADLAIPQPDPTTG
jgi:transcriptional regulator